MNRTVLVIDDFRVDADAWRHTALTAAYKPARKKGSPGYPGSESVESFLTPEDGAQMTALIGRTMTVTGGHFRSIQVKDIDGPGVHTDTEFGGVYYLSLPEHCRGGTALYRHRSTGLEKLPPKEALTAELKKRLLLDGLDASAWEQTVFVPMRFNRLVLFDAMCFHSGTIPFGDSLASSRLSQNFFFGARRS